MWLLTFRGSTILIYMYIYIYVCVRLVHAYIYVYICSCKNAGFVALSPSSPSRLGRDLGILNCWHSESKDYLKSCLRQGHFSAGTDC